MLYVMCGLSSLKPPKSPSAPAFGVYGDDPLLFLKLYVWSDLQITDDWQVRTRL